MTIIVGDTGLIIVDPLSSVETAAAGLALARRTLGDKPVVAVIYTHSPRSTILAACAASCALTSGRLLRSSRPKVSWSTR